MDTVLACPSSPSIPVPQGQRRRIISSYNHCVGSLFINCSLGIMIAGFMQQLLYVRMLWFGCCCNWRAYSMAGILRRGCFHWFLGPTALLDNYVIAADVCVVQSRPRNQFSQTARAEPHVTTCLENLEISWNLTVLTHHVTEITFLVGLKVFQLNRTEKKKQKHAHAVGTTICGRVM